MTKVNTFGNPFTALTDNNGNKYDVVEWESSTPYHNPTTMEYTFKCRLAESPNALIEELRRTVANKETRIIALRDELQSLRDRINNASEALEGDD